MAAYEFDNFQSATFEEGTENGLVALPYARAHKIDWAAIMQHYEQLRPGQGMLSHQLLNYAKSGIVAAFERRGLLLDEDYKIFVAHVDANGARLPNGNWLQYIKRLSSTEPSLL